MVNIISDYLFPCWILTTEYTYTHTHVCVYVCVCVCVYVCVCMYVYVHMYMCVCICMYVCVYVCMYVCMLRGLTGLLEFRIYRWMRIIRKTAPCRSVTIVYFGKPFLIRIHISY